jgi:polar amino acid transport system ATP-binding protein
MAGAEDARLMLSVENLHKDYGNEEVLRGVSFGLERSEVVVVLGVSGCGKSTLLRCINGLEHFRSGKIVLDGETLTAASDWNAVRRRVGMVFQSYDLFPHMTVAGNMTLAARRVLKMPNAEAVDRARELLGRVGLGDKFASYPSELSGGQKQRVAICRALMMNPELMLFDEVTAALDPEMTREVTDVMRELADSGMTMIIVTHEIEFAKAIADRTLFMDGGEIAEEGDPTTFFDNPSTERARRFLNIFRYQSHHGDYI